MTIHTLKCWPADFQAVADGAKTHEARHDDRGFKVGDTLILREWRPFSEALCHWRLTRALGSYTSRSLVCNVTHVTRGQYGLPTDLAIMSIRLERKRVEPEQVDNLEAEAEAVAEEKARAGDNGSRPYRALKSAS